MVSSSGLPASSSMPSPNGARCSITFTSGPDRKGRGIGRRLFDAAREWSFEQLGHQSLHLWVIEANLEGQQFYNRIGGTIAERKIKDVVGVVKLPALRYVWK